MSDRADEIARKIIRECTDDVEEYALLEHRIVAALRAYAEEVRREEREACAQMLYDTADDFSIVAAAHTSKEIVHGAITDVSCLVANLAAAIRARRRQ